MFRQITFFDNFTNSLTGTWLAFLMQGLIFFLIGLGILLFPQLLVAMVAAGFMFVGILFLIVAWKTRGLRSRYRGLRDQFWEPL